MLIVSGYRAGEAQWALQFNETGALVNANRYQFAPTHQTAVSKMMGMHGSSMYLADQLGRVAVYPAL